MIDSDRRPVYKRRPILKSASTYVNISNKSWSNLRVFSNQRPFQILRSMANLLLSNRRPFQSEDLYVLLPCHMMDVGQICTSVLHIISNECKKQKQKQLYCKFRNNCNEILFFCVFFKTYLKFFIIQVSTRLVISLVPN